MNDTCDIIINNERKLSVKAGTTLLKALSAEKIFIPSACGGRGSCGYCKLRINKGAGDILPSEEPFLSDDERQANFRLSCQITVTTDMEISIPKRLLMIKEYTCVCEDIQSLTDDIKQFRLKLIDPAVMDYIPGQYIYFFTPAYDGNPEGAYRAYSISSDPYNKNILELIIRLVPGGICTTYCFNQLKVGDTVKINGPHGAFRLRDTQAPVIFVAGGSGMAPIKCMLHHMKNINCKRKAVYYFGGNQVKDLFLTPLMKEFEKELHDFTYIPVVAKPETDWHGEQGLVTEAIARSGEDLSSGEAYMCGSQGMIEAAIPVLKTLGVPETKIYYDKF